MARARHPIRLEAVSATAAEAGDYFQVMFEGAGDEERRPYLLLQRQFEDPDEEECYFESSHPEFGGHFRVRSARLDRGEFVVSFEKAGLEAKVALKGRIDDYDEFRRILKIVIPEVEILKWADPTG